MSQQTLNRKMQSQKTKEKIFSTAVNLIRQQGYQAVSVNEICQMAGVAKGTFYVHYQSKEDIIRESYYSDMGNFILNHFHKYEAENDKASLYQKIEAFLLLEFAFAEYIGYELTCLAYSMNLSNCIPGPCKHFENRAFTDKLYDMVQHAISEKVFNPQYTAEEIFLYLETSVRGMMASWCFSNGNFSICHVGKKYIASILQCYIQNKI